MQFRNNENRDSGEAFDVLARLLMRRTHTVHELRRKLRERGFSSSDIRAALERADELNYLDDHSAAEQIIKEQIRKGGHGRKWVEEKLREKGIDKDLGVAAMQEIWDLDMELKSAIKVSQKWVANQKSGVDPYKQRGKLFATLQRRGFTSDIIRVAAKNALSIEE